MTKESQREKYGLTVFRRQMALTLLDLLKLFGGSLRTVQRRLKAWQAHTSYNQNGRYYTLPDIPIFDAQGLWHYRDVSFSKHGNLKQTVIGLVNDSVKGLSAEEIGAILRMKARSFLPHFKNVPELHREQMGRRFIWFAADAETRQRQREARFAQEQTELISLPSDRAAVMILVDLLHHPYTDVAAIARRLKSKNQALGLESIQAFLAHHALLKKTTDQNSSVV